MLETRETQVRSLGQDDLLEEGMATCSSIAAWRIPWTEEPAGLQSTGLHRSDTAEATEHSHTVRTPIVNLRPLPETLHHL